jgi:DNA-binding CsgD family transcriptional regulator
MSPAKRPDHTCLNSCLVGAALEGMCVGLIVTSPAGRVQWMNRTAQHILETKLDDCEGELLSRVIRDPNLSEFWHRAFAESGNVIGEVSMQVPQAAELKANSTNSVSPEGEHIEKILLFCDVTREKSVQLSLSRVAAERLIDLAERNVKTAAPIEGLTPQELRVLRMVGEGLGNQEIAEAMHVAPSTVRSHLKQVYRKTGLGSRAEAISFAIQNQLT